MKVTKSSDGNHHYVVVQGIKDKEEQRIIFDKVTLLIKEWESNLRVF